MYSLGGDGVHVWNTESVLLGKLLVEEGNNNFPFIPDGMLVFDGKKLYLATVVAKRERDVAGT
jgi:gluconolactonase